MDVIKKHTFTCVELKKLCLWPLQTCLGMDTGTECSADVSFTDSQQKILKEYFRYFKTVLAVLLLAVWKRRRDLGNKATFSCAPIIELEVRVRRLNLLFS